jgi:MFS family permease
MRLSPKSLALAATSIFLSLTFIDETGVAVTLPAMSESFGLSQLGIQWVMNAFFLTLAVSVLGCGRLADIVGHRKIFL